MKVKLENNKGKIEKKKGIGLNNGECIFPFTYKNQTYNKCYPGSSGDWCATDINKKNNKIKQWAYCVYEEDSSSEDEEEEESLNQLIEQKWETHKDQKKLDEFEKNDYSPNTYKRLYGSIAPKTKKKLKSKSKPNLKIKSKPKLKIVTKKTNRKFDPLSINSNWRLPTPDIVTPKKYILNNKKAFINWFDTTYRKYRVKTNKQFVKQKRFDYFNHQKIIRDYMNHNTPFRGLLLYHGLGVGKTCGSIAIAEGFRTDKKIIILLNKSLRQNFKDNLRFCGFDYFRINQHWVYHKFKTDDPMKTFAKNLNLQIKSDTKGAWFINFKDMPNFHILNEQQRSEINEQIEYMIDKRYNFLNLDGLNEKALIKLKENREFDNSVLIIDEIHNLTNAMSKKSPGIRAKYLEQIIMEASDLNIIGLSGTPMINNLYETAKLFNLLRGYINTYNIKLNTSPNWDNITELLHNNIIIDQFFINKRDNSILLTRIPRFFTKKGRGIIKNDTTNLYSDDEFVKYLKALIPDITIKIQKYTAFPNNEEEFMKKFFDYKTLTFKNTELFKSRILGLVSYYRTQDSSLIPEVINDEIVKVNMSEYQFLNYAKVRKDEIENDKAKGKLSKPKKKSSKEDIYEIKSSYRAYSRMHCSFVFPEKIPRPYPIDEEDDSSIEQDFKELVYKTKQKEKYRKYEIEKTTTLNLLNKDKYLYLTNDKVDKLIKYSPKYSNILDKVSKNKGTSFIYTEYKTLEGIAIFSIVLKANGYAPFIIKQNSKKEYEQIYENEDDISKPKYAFWGEGTSEENEIIRKVFNNEFTDLPDSLKEQITNTFKTNLRGETIKILLTTKTGAEGIDLKNVRQVHIVEPYWNPVRIKQVKGRAVRVGSHVQLPSSERNVSIYLYLATILPDMKKTDRIIEMDKGGATSDEVLYELSQKKLKIMETFLRIIKEASIDCSLNLNDTYGEEDDFNCLSYGTTLDNSYSFIPNINEETEDTDLRRKIMKTSWKPDIMTFNIKGVKRTFAVRPAPPNEKKLLYDVDVLKESGRPGEPLGFLEIKDGKQSIVLYKVI